MRFFPTFLCSLCERSCGNQFSRFEIHLLRGVQFVCSSCFPALVKVGAEDADLYRPLNLGEIRLPGDEELNNGSWVSIDPALYGQNFRLHSRATRRPREKSN